MIQSESDEIGRVQGGMAVDPKVYIFRIEYIQYKNINEIFYSPFFILGLWN